MLGNRGIWADGWKAVADHVISPSFDEDKWELYHTDEDFMALLDLEARASGLELEPEDAEVTDGLAAGTIDLALGYFPDLKQHNFFQQPDNGDVQDLSE